jgi:hypothetical protein
MALAISPVSLCDNAAQCEAAMLLYNQTLLALPFGLGGTSPVWSICSGEAGG